MEFEVERLHSSTKEYGSGFMMLSMNMYAVFVRYLHEGRVRAPPAKDLEEMSPTFQCGAKTDRRALQSKFKSWAKRMTLIDGRLVLACNGKVIVPRESCEDIVAALHFNNPEVHSTLDEIVAEIQKRYTWSKKNFGMDWHVVCSTLSIVCDREECLTKLHDRLYRPAIMESKATYAANFSGGNRSQTQKIRTVARKSKVRLVDICRMTEENVKTSENSDSATTDNDKEASSSYCASPKTDFLAKLKLKSVIDDAKTEEHATGPVQSSPTKLWPFILPDRDNDFRNASVNDAEMEFESGIPDDDFWEKYREHSVRRNLFRTEVTTYDKSNGSGPLFENNRDKFQTEPEQYSPVCYPDLEIKAFPEWFLHDRVKVQGRVTSQSSPQPRNIFPTALYAGMASPLAPSPMANVGGNAEKHGCGDHNEDVYILPDVISTDVAKQKSATDSEDAMVRGDNEGGNGNMSWLSDNSMCDMTLQNPNVHTDLATPAWRIKGPFSATLLPAGRLNRLLLTKPDVNENCPRPPQEQIVAKAKPKIWRPDPDVMGDGEPRHEDGRDLPQLPLRPISREWPLPLNHNRKNVLSQSESSQNVFSNYGIFGKPSPSLEAKKTTNRQRGKIIHLTSSKNRSLAPKLHSMNVNAHQGNNGNRNTEASFPLPRKFRFFKIVF